MDKNLLNQLKSAVQPFDLDLVIVFGSLVKDRLSPTSDIDIAVAGKTPLNLEQKIELATKISQKVKREVDIVDLKQVSGVILKEALTKGKILKNKDKELFAYLLRKLWYHQADMMPHINRILEARRKRFLNG